MRCHKVYRRGSDRLGSRNQIALILTVLVIDQNDHLPLLEIRKNFRNFTKFNHFIFSTVRLHYQTTQYNPFTPKCKQKSKKAYAPTKQQTSHGRSPGIPLNRPSPVNRKHLSGYIVTFQQEHHSIRSIARLTCPTCRNKPHLPFLVNSAAVFKRQAIAEVDLASIEEVLNTNLVGPILVSKRFAELLDRPADCDEPVGKIVNISDVGAIKPWAEYSVYCASKAGLVAVTKAMAKELAPGVCVNSVAPGVITWPDGFTEEDKKRQLGFIPAGRTGQPSDVANAVVFLLESDYIT
ncbi:MAG TPA: SDR family oxidoreductase, partial [Phycisphaerales bacterium]|nr:SDR family oxidoreductase [Phycisphaerales bacterium]